MPRTTVLAAVCFTLLSSVVGFAQTPAHATSTDAQAKVPELERFHTSIYKLWHTAWPKKDITMLTALVPDIEKGAAAVAAATLPGILREKQDQWKTGVAALQVRVTEYTAAAQAGDSVKLLAAAEQLHSQYEALVRTIRPVLKQVGQFHETLYVLYHYYVPEFTIDSIVVSAGVLRQKMEALNAATLPERLKAREETFVAARTKLSASVEAFSAAAETRDKKKITQAMDRVHTDYQALEAVFD